MCKGIHHGAELHVLRGHPVAGRVAAVFHPLRAGGAYSRGFFEGAKTSFYLPETLNLKP